MGIIRMGPPEDLVLRLRREFGLSTFVETGTFRGNTARWAAAQFESVVTIENSAALFRQAVTALKPLSNVRVVFGDSGALLGSIIADMRSSAVFWLDSHWCGGESYGMEDQCPLEAELAAISASKVPHFVLIDDARLFLSPPPEPHRIADWSTISQVCSYLESDEYERYTVVYEDVIISVPTFARDILSSWCRQRNAAKRYATSPGLVSETSGSVRVGLREMRTGVAKILRGVFAAVRRGRASH